MRTPCPHSADGATEAQSEGCRRSPGRSPGTLLAQMQSTHSQHPCHTHIQAHAACSATGAPRTRRSRHFQPRAGPRHGHAGQAQLGPPPWSATARWSILVPLLLSILNADGQLCADAQSLKVTTFPGASDPRQGFPGQGHRAGWHLKELALFGEGLAVICSFLALFLECKSLNNKPWEEFPGDSEMSACHTPRLCG